ncbi:MAG: response regulator transcription factor [Thermoanaerobaculia bacterium]|nr:response regulator transcription factor [Thermoanaerobaculia bacterium]
MIRLFIIDDHPVVITGVKQAVGSHADIQLAGYAYRGEEALEWLAAVYAGKRYLSEEVSEKLISKATKQASAKTGFVPKLTRREKEVLDLIMEECTTQEIAERLFLSVSTVETHRLKLFAKLDAKNVVGLVKNAIKFGLV